MASRAPSFVFLLSLACYSASGTDQQIKVADVNGAKPVRFMALTFVTHATEGLERLLRSSEAYGVDLNVIKIKSVDYWISTFCEILLNVRQFVERYKNEKDLIILLIDGYDVVFNGGTEEIVNKFYEFDANIVFGAEDPCFPNIGMQYISPKELEGYKCLNSGMVIGYAPELHALLQYKLRLGTAFDDQVHFSRLFMIPEIRESLNMKLDYKANVMQNLNYIPDQEYELVITENDTQFVNVRFGTKPALIHGNGLLGKIVINMVGNYVGKAWSTSGRCKHCKEGRIALSKRVESDYPVVLLGIFVSQRTPFLPEMLKKVSALLYPQKRIFIYVYNKVAEQESKITQWMLSHAHNYLATKFTSSIEHMHIIDAKQLALDTCIEISCDLFFNVESVVHLDNPNTLQLLVSYNRTILAPVMSRINSYFSTFWGAINYWYYERSFDYFDIIQRKNVGIWNVPYISGVYVVWRSVFQNEKEGTYRRRYKTCPDEIASIFSAYHRLKQNFMYVVNYEAYGHLVDTDNGDANERESDLWQLKTNPKDWEDKYLNPNYSQRLNNESVTDKSAEISSILPLFSELFCEDFKEAVLLSNENKTLTNFEDKNQLDVNFNQLKEIGYQLEWLHIFEHYILPLGKPIVQEDHPTNYVIRIAVTKGDTNKPCMGKNNQSKQFLQTLGDMEWDNEIIMMGGIPLSKCSSPHQRWTTFVSLI